MDGRGGLPPAARLALSAAVIAGAVIVLGSLVTWAEARVPFLGTIAVDGFDDDRQGRWTLTLGAAIAAVGATAAWGRWFAARGAVVALLGIAAIAVGFEEAGDLQDVDKRIQHFGRGVIDTELKLGLPLVIGGGALATLAGAASTILALSGRRPPGDGNTAER
jgi:hypothetical protein